MGNRDRFDGWSAGWHCEVEVALFDVRQALLEGWSLAAAIAVAASETTVVHGEEVEFCEDGSVRTAGGIKDPLYWALIKAVHHQIEQLAGSDTVDWRRGTAEQLQEDVRQFSWQHSSLSGSDNAMEVVMSAEDYHGAEWRRMNQQQLIEERANG